MLVFKSALAELKQHHSLQGLCGWQVQLVHHVHLSTVLNKLELSQTWLYQHYDREAAYNWQDNTVHVRANLHVASTGAIVNTGHACLPPCLSAFDLARKSPVNTTALLRFASRAGVTVRPVLPESDLRLFTRCVDFMSYPNTSCEQSDQSHEVGSSKVRGENSSMNYSTIHLRNRGTSTCIPVTSLLCIHVLNIAYAAATVKASAYVSMVHRPCLPKLDSSD